MSIYQPFTYYLYHKPTGLKYYGSKYGKNANPSNLWTTYFSSSKYVKELIKNYGKDSFSVEIRKTFKTAEQAVLWESKVLKRLKIKERKDWINCSYNDPKFILKHQTKEARDKIGKSKLGIPRSQELKDRLSKMKKGIPTGVKRSEESKRALSEKYKGRFFSDEWKKKISDARKGQKSWNKGKKVGPLSEEHKNKISKSLIGNQYAKGMKHSEETKLQMSLSNKGKNKGKTRTPEQREVLSKAMKGRSPWNKNVTHSQETRQKLSEANKLYNINKQQTKYTDCVYMPY